MATQFATMVGVVVLIWYTIETCRLRKEAQRQTAMTAMPALFVRTQRRPSSSSLFLNVENIGKGPAFNVCFESLTGPDCKLTFKPIPLLLVGEQHKEVESDIEEISAESYDTASGAIASLMSQERLPRELTLMASFQDLSGRRYKSSFLVRCDGFVQELIGDLSITISFLSQTR